MTDITRTFDIFDQSVRVHKKDNQPAVVGSSFSGTSTPERYGRQQNTSIEMVANHRNQQLRKSNGHSNSESASSTMTGPTSREVNCCEVYYLSPSKRKNCDNLQQQQIGTSNPTMHRTSSMRKTQKGNSIDSAASWVSSIAQHCRTERPSMVSIATRSSPIDTATVYSKFSNSRTQQGLDNFDICSHYSDSAAIPMPSRYNGITATNNSSGGFYRDGNGSSSSSIAIVSNGPRTSNVTFSNRTEEHQIHSNRGSLRRSKGRSNQSLCSCDVGDDTEIIPDPNRPLYQYSLDRKNKKHTYTCEQNAQILMRLEREKIRKLSGTPGIAASSSSITIDKQGKDINQTGLNNSFDTSSFDYHDTNTSLESDSTAEIDNIPPPPPPPASVIRSHQLKASFPKDPMKSQFSKNSYEFESILNDCTTTILNCANVSHIGKQHHQQQHQQQQPKQENSTKYSQTSLKSSSHENRENYQSEMPHPCIRDDAFLSSTKLKDEDSMYFYHQETPIFVPNYENRPIPTIMGKYNTIGPSSYNAKQLANYHHHHQQNDTVEMKSKQGLHQHPHRFEQNNKGSCNLGHFDSNNLTNGGRYFSQSLTNFSLNCSADNNDPHELQQPHKTQPQQHHNYIHGTKYNQPQAMMHSHPNSYTQEDQHDKYHQWHQNYNHDTVGRLGLTDIAQAVVDNISNPYTKFPRTTSSSNGLVGSCSFGGDSNLINSSFTTLESPTSGLKGKFYEQEHLHHHHQHHQQQPEHHPHHQQQQQQQQSQLQQQQQFHSSTSSIMPWKHRQCPSHGSSSSGTNSLRFDAAKHWLAVSSILLIIGAASVAVPLALRVAASAPFEERLRVATQLLDQVPLIDGHNDLPWNIRKFLHNKLNDFNFDEDLRNVMPWARSNWSHTDLQRLKKGRVAAQFWAAYVPCEAQHRDAVQLTLEQIDVIKRLTERYSPQLTTCTSASDIIEAHKNLQLCSLTGVEGGHSLGGSLAVLRTLYAIGVRYMTLTSTCHTPWADSSYADAPTFNVKHGGLTAFGKTIIREMNRLGMIVDLSHVSTGTMRDALDVSEAPVIFSHSSAYELCNSSRNVQDDILQSIAKNGGLVMVNFYSRFLSCSDNSTVHDAVAHINHIKQVAGIDHVGLGAGFDGINFTPKGLEDVSSYPTLFAELLGEGWSIDDLTKLAGGNFLRVMLDVEKLRDLKKLSGIKPFEDHPNFRTEDPYNCTSS